MAKAGRKPKSFDPELFQDLCKIQCTQGEICNILKTTDKTLVSWVKREYKMEFSEAYKRFADAGKMSLRRAMFKKAVVEGNATMQIWLSKQYLGMTDKIVNENIEYEYTTPDFLKSDDKAS
jgi:hypothetical protein